MATIRVSEKTKLNIETLKRTKHCTATCITGNAVHVYSKLVAAETQGAKIVIEWPSDEKTQVLLP